MIRALAIVACLFAIACDGQDVVAIAAGDSDAGVPPGYCAGDGPPILVGDGITVGEGDGSSDDVCSGEITVRTFRKALCTCEDYVTSTPLVTDSFDSAAAPYAPGGTEGPVGLNSTVQSSATVDIGGTLTIGGTAQLGADLDIAGDAEIGGDLGTAVDVSVGGDARIAGSINLASLTVAGSLTVPAGETIAGTVNAGSTVRAAVTVEPPCACEASDLVDIDDFVTGHRVDNDNDLIDLAPTALTNYSGPTTLELPCGRFYIGPVHGQGALTLRVTGRAVLLVDGDFAMTAPLVLELVGEDAELDLMIAGLLTSNNTIDAGDPDHPARTRIYVGGSGVITLTGNANFAANLYAPLAAVSLSGTAELFGSLFVRRLEQAAPVMLHYDLDVLRADSGC